MAKSSHYGRIINTRHFDRLQRLLQSTEGQIVEGGEFRRPDLFISPTIVEGVQPDEPLMEEEIFGPILPILTYNRLEEAIRFIKDRPKPLALYVFSKDDKVSQRVLRETSSGCACVNDTLMQIGNLNYGFGGVGDSGMGSYHGKNGFEAFSHAKSVMNRSTMVDAPMRYPPYKMSVAMLKTLLKRLT